MQNSIAALGGIIAILMYTLLKGGVGNWYKWRDARRDAKRNRVIKVKPLK